MSKYDLGWDDGYGGFPLPKTIPEGWSQNEWDEYKEGYSDGNMALLVGFTMDDE